MPDWEKLVGERLERLKLATEERREVIAEIAAHLDECYVELRDAGSPDPEGYTLAQVSDWNVLRRKIRRAKEGGMSFARRVMFPGLTALFLAQVALAVILHSLIALHGPALEGQFRGGDRVPGIFYVPWMLTLPWIGAVGAWLARRAGARPGQRLTAALFPALFAVVVNTIFGVVALLISPQKLLSEFNLANQASLALFFVVLPAIACAIGAWPFLSGKPHQAETAPPSDAARA